MGAAVAELSALSRNELRARAAILGVSRKDESKQEKARSQLEEDCRLALEAQQSEVQWVERALWRKYNQMAQLGNDS